MMNFNAKYDIIECIMSHDSKVKYDKRGVPTSCKKCEHVDARPKNTYKVREYGSLISR